MFGTNDNSQQSNDDPAMLDNVKQLASEPAHAVEPPQQAFSSSAPVVDLSAPNFSATHTAVAEPAQGFSSAPLPEPPSTPDPVTDDVPPIITSPSATTSYNDSPASTSSNDTSNDVTATQPVTDAVDPDHLAGMKQEALQHLEPLVEHLEGTPEETFKTTMMMIQANDNHTLLEKALEAAKKIEDDKVRAQAMLDIVNEINYFSQNS